MKHKTLRFGRGFHLMLGNKHSQAATMVLQPGETEGGPDNNHRGSDQWLFVTSGTGVATVNGRRCRLRTGSLVLIERGDRHEIRATGTTALQTLNIYFPPAYRNDDEELPAGRSKTSASKH